ncbi:MAG: class I SAM-dependent methyltransferase [Verrucomicrobia bacterium]|nr:class I SAM-dependent methyltransferase [Verrucomicrobiota bacterium]
MEAEFNVNDYWLERGRDYMREQRTPPEFHRMQERFLLGVLQRSALPMRRVLEIGCGFGRVTRLLAEAWPEAEIMAVDLSPEQLANARRYCSDAPRVRFAPYDFYSNEPLPGAGYDMALAVEVFLHHPPEAVVGLARRLADAACYVVNIDWSESWPWPTPEHVWVHDFAGLYAQAGLVCAAFPLPGKIEGKQQQLFVAGRTLPESVRQLENTLRPAAASAQAPAAADAWTQRLAMATDELRRLIPGQSRWILVDDAQWGRVRALSGYRIVPFLEKDGAWWGPPADDATAWEELQRLRRAGASHLVFAWPAFWWLQHYADFSERLRATFPCVLENNRLVVFALGS